MILEISKEPENTLNPKPRACEVVDLLWFPAKDHADLVPGTLASTKVRVCYNYRCC